MPRAPARRWRRRATSGWRATRRRGRAAEVGRAGPARRRFLWPRHTPWTVYQKSMPSGMATTGADADCCAATENRKPLPSPRHQREHTPAKILARVRGVAHGFRTQFGVNILRELIAGIGVKPSAHGEPFGRLVPIPAVLISQNHCNDVAAKLAERREKFWQHEKVGDGVGKTPFGNILRRRQLANKTMTVAAPRQGSRGHEQIRITFPVSSISQPRQHIRGGSHAGGGRHRAAAR